MLGAFGEKSKLKRFYGPLGAHSSEECLSKLILFGEASLRRLLLFPSAEPTSAPGPSIGCRERLVNYYHRRVAWVLDPSPYKARRCHRQRYLEGDRIGFHRCPSLHTSEKPQD
jgi:hypothetical protein